MRGVDGAAYIAPTSAPCRPNRPLNVNAAPVAVPPWRLSVTEPSPSRLWLVSTLGGVGDFVAELARGVECWRRPGSRDWVARSSRYSRPGGHRDGWTAFPHARSDRTRPVGLRVLQRARAGNEPPVGNNENRAVIPGWLHVKYSSFVSPARQPGLAAPAGLNGLPTGHQRAVCRQHAGVATASPVTRYWCRRRTCYCWRRPRRQPWRLAGHRRAVPRGGINSPRRWRTCTSPWLPGAGGHISVAVPGRSACSAGWRLDELGIPRRWRTTMGTLTPGTVLVEPRQATARPRPGAPEVANTTWRVAGALAHAGRHAPPSGARYARGR